MEFNSKKWTLHVLALEQHSDIFWKGLVKKVGNVFYYDTKQSGNVISVFIIVTAIRKNHLFHLWHQNHHQTVRSAIVLSPCKNSLSYRVEGHTLKRYVQ